MDECVLRSRDYGRISIGHAPQILSPQDRRVALSNADALF